MSQTVFQALLRVPESRSRQRIKGWPAATSLTCRRNQRGRPGWEARTALVSVASWPLALRAGASRTTQIVAAVPSALNALSAMDTPHTQPILDILFLLRTLHSQGAWNALGRLPPRITSQLSGPSTVCRPPATRRRTLPSYTKRLPRGLSPPPHRPSLAEIALRPVLGKRRVRAPERSMRRPSTGRPLGLRARAAETPLPRRGAWPTEETKGARCSRWTLRSSPPPWGGPRRPCPWNPRQHPFPRRPGGRCLGERGRGERCGTHGTHGT